MAWPLATYKFELLTLMKKNERCIKAFEIKGLRQMLGIKWTKRKEISPWAFEKAGTAAQLWVMLKKRVNLF